jgi:hypothetical protein
MLSLKLDDHMMVVTLALRETTSGFGGKERAE